MQLEYSGGDKLYVPVSNLHLISRYSVGTDGETHLNKLGNDTWAKAKNKAIEKIRDVAAELLDVYARRQARPPDDPYRPHRPRRLPRTLPQSDSGGGSDASVHDPTGTGGAPGA